MRDERGYNLRYLHRHVILLGARHVLSKRPYFYLDPLVQMPEWEMLLRLPIGYMVC